jgi:hypothetical protein
MLWSGTSQQAPGQQASGQQACDEPGLRAVAGQQACDGLGPTALSTVHTLDFWFVARVCSRNSNKAGPRWKCWSGRRSGQRTCPGGIAARAAVPDVVGWGGMAARAGAGANLDPLVGPAAVVIRSFPVAPGGTSSVNVFQGSERPSARTSTKAGLFKKIDGLVYPGRDGKEATDTKEKWERFAKCAVGTHGGASGYSRMSALRQRTGVKKECDTLQSPCKRAHSDRQGPAGL